MGTVEKEKLGYPAKALDAWAERLRLWSAGDMPKGLEAPIGKAAKKEARDVFFYVISGFKEKNPAAAMSLIERLSA
jgi:hypothetical protein